jgi:hypothetical protein
VSPALPESWGHASIKTPEYSLAFIQAVDVDRYTIRLARPAKLRLQFAIHAKQVKGVRVNGQSARWEIEPAAGCGMMTIELTETNQADVAITLAKRVPQSPAIKLEKKVGEKKSIAKSVDPQRCLDADAKPGWHLAFARVEQGNVPYFQLYQVLVTDPKGEVQHAKKNLRQADPGAKWATVPLEQVFNSDVTKIFQQKYLSPRPETVSCRIGYDGWSAWTFYPWKIAVPQIKLDGLPALRNSESRLVTPQRAVFAPVAAGKNIAFTSLWDNWPRLVKVQVQQAGEAVWLLICGSTNPMQGRIANAVLTFRYADGQEERLELVPPANFWSLCRFGRADYDYQRDSFSMPKEPPPQVQLGENCRAMVYGWKLRPEVVLKEVTLETLSQDVIIGLMGVSVMNPK